MFIKLKREIDYLKINNILGDKIKDFSMEAFQLKYLQLSIIGNRCRIHRNEMRGYRKGTIIGPNIYMKLTQNYVPLFFPAASIILHLLAFRGKLQKAVVHRKDHRQLLLHKNEYHTETMPIYI